MKGDGEWCRKMGEERKRAGLNEKGAPVSSLGAACLRNYSCLVPALRSAPLRRATPRHWLLR